MPGLRASVVCGSCAVPVPVCAVASRSVCTSSSQGGSIALTLARARAIGNIYRAVKSVSGGFATSRAIRPGASRDIACEIRPKLRK
jgi:hypothetical protein